MARGRGRGAGHKAGATIIRQTRFVDDSNTRQAPPDLVTCDNGTRYPATPQQPPRSLAARPYTESMPPLPAS